MPCMLIPIGRLPFPHLFQPWTEALPGQEPRYSAVLIVNSNGQKSSTAPSKHAQDLHDEMSDLMRTPPVWAPPPVGAR